MGSNNNNLAVASLATSIAGLVLGFCCTPLALATVVGAILGHVALGQIRTSGEDGRGLAIGGVVVGWAGFALSVVLTVLLLSGGLLLSGSSAGATV